MIFVQEDRETTEQGGGGCGDNSCGFGSGPGGDSNRIECRVYVGNLPWDCKWQDLKDHMRLTGEVLHADVLHGPDGRAKGCGLVEYQFPHEAQRAIQDLHNSELMGRLIFVREDREDEKKKKRKRFSEIEDWKNRKR